VPREDELDAGLPRRVEQVEHLAAWQAEHPLDAGFAQRCGDHVRAARHA
jgi:hypothetical protein